MLFIICCIVYATAYIARINYSTAISAMQTHGVLTEDISALIVHGLFLNGAADRNNLRQEIYYCKKYGVNNHLERQGKVYSFYKEHLYGMAYYILMINKDTGRKFLNELNEIQWDY